MTREGWLVQLDGSATLEFMPPARLPTPVFETADIVVAALAVTGLIIAQQVRRTHAPTAPAALPAETWQDDQTTASIIK